MKVWKKFIEKKWQGYCFILQYEMVCINWCTFNVVNIKYVYIENKMFCFLTM